MKTSDLPFATRQQQTDAFKEANEFLKTTRMYSSAMDTACIAIAEFLLFKQGRQMVRDSRNKPGIFSEN